MVGKINVPVVVDQLGEVQAEIAKLKVHEQSLKDMLMSRAGEGAYEGNLFRATVSVCDRGTLDMKAVREKLSPQFIAANTKHTEVWTVKVVARNNVNVKEAA